MIVREERERDGSTDIYVGMERRSIDGEKKDKEACTAAAAAETHCWLHIPRRLHETRCLRTRRTERSRSSAREGHNEMYR